MRARKDEPSSCAEPDCGRAAYARGLCQTHHKQVQRLGRTGPIRPYRKRAAGTVKFAGFRLSETAAEKLRRRSEALDQSRGATIAGILEEWVRRKLKRRKR